MSTILLTGMGGAGTPETASLLTSLAAHWRMEESAGATRADSTANAQNLTDNNTVGQVAGQVGTNAANFTALMSTYLSHADSTTLSIGDNQAFTIAGWVYPGTATVIHAFISKDNGVQREYSIYKDTSEKVNFALFGSGGNVTLTSDDALSISAWNFIICWYDGSTIYIQVNAGTIKSTAASQNGAQDSTAAFEIGRLQGAIYYNGRVDSVSLWKRALNATERAALWNSGAGLDYSGF